MFSLFLIVAGASHAACCLLEVLLPFTGDLVEEARAV